MHKTVDAVSGIEEAVVALLRDLIRCPSLGPSANATRDALALLSEFLTGAGIDVDIRESSTGVPTLVATLDSGAPGTNLLLQGHIDVVPVDVAWQRDPFGALVEQGEIHGRGSCDMKAGLACFAGVMVALRQTGALDQGSVTLLVDVDEETGSDTGLIPFIDTYGLDNYDWAICAEPTALFPYLGNRGLLWITVTVEGVAAHAGMPSAGRNPIPVAADIIQALPDHPGPPGPLGSPPASLTVTTFHSGTVVNSIADKAVFTIDRRLVPGEAPVDILDEISRAIDSAARRHADFTVTVDVTKRWPPCLIDEGSALALAAWRATESVVGDVRFGFDEACNDASFLSEAGVPTLIWGPGDPDLAHTSREKVSLADVQRAMIMYLDAIEQLTSASHRTD